MSDFSKYFMACMFTLVFTGSSGFLLQGQLKQPSSTDMLAWTEAEQVAWLNSYIDTGMVGGQSASLLVLNRSRVALPILEKRIEEILSSPKPKTLFADPKIDPDRVVEMAASMIAYAGNDQALWEASKLMRIDESRFGDLVKRTLASAQDLTRAFTISYLGLQIGDPAVDNRIMAWIEGLVNDQKASARQIHRRSWAEAMVKRYGRAPTKSEIASDPIAHRLPSIMYAAIEADLERFTIEEAKNFPSKQ